MRERVLESSSLEESYEEESRAISGRWQRFLLPCRLSAEPSGQTLLLPPGISGRRTASREGCSSRVRDQGGRWGQGITTHLPSTAEWICVHRTNNICLQKCWGEGKDLGDLGKRREIECRGYKTVICIPLLQIENSSTGEWWLLEGWRCIQLV